jgi:pilus assembly protein FimV
MRGISESELSIEVKRREITRIFARSLGAALLFVVSAALHAVELSTLTVDSYLYEPFKAEITLKGLPDDNSPQDLSVGLASAQTHMASGLILNPTVEDFEFSFDFESDRPRILIRSSQPVKVPFLRFLLQVDTVSGRLLRDYTAILDPPNYFYFSSPLEPEASESKGADTLYPGERYGPVRPGLTLIQIARGLKAEPSTTLHQKLAALVADNPDAFIDGNMNRLRENSLLHMPSQRLMSKNDAAEASSIYEDHLMGWLEGQAQADPTQSTQRNWVAVAAMEGSEALLSSGVDDQASTDYVLRIVQSGPKVAKAPDHADSGPSVTVSDATIEITSARDNQIIGLTERLTNVEEALGSKELENSQLNQQVELLQMQLEKTMQLIELQETQLVLAQRQLEVMLSQQTQGLGIAQTATSDDSPAGVEPKAAGMTTDQPDTNPAGGAQTEALPQTASTDTAPALESDSLAALDPPADALAWGESVGPAAAPPWEDPAQALDWATEWGQFLFSKGIDWLDVGLEMAGTLKAFVPDSIGNSENMPMFLGLLVLLLIWVLIRRRRGRKIDVEEGGRTPTPDRPHKGSIFRSQATEPAPDPTTQQERSQREESMGAGFVTEIETQRGVAVQSDEVDPLAEAEIYLAYGRGAQAEQTLRDAIRRAPERSELKIKLLEVYQTLGQKAQFDRLTQELSEILEPNSPEWANVIALGRTPESSNLSLKDVSSDSAPIDLSENNHDPVAPVAPTPAATTQSVDRFDEGMEFEVETDPSLPIPKAESKKISSAPQHSAMEGVEDAIEFDIEVPLPAEESLRDNPISPVTPEVSGDTLSSSELLAGAESATQLDLASAYLEIGDVMTARDLLEAVEREGDPEQITRAQALLADIKST